MALDLSNKADVAAASDEQFARAVTTEPYAWIVASINTSVFAGFLQMVSNLDLHQAIAILLAVASATFLAIGLVRRNSPLNGRLDSPANLESSVS